MSNKEGYLHDYLAASFIGLIFGLIGWQTAAGLQGGWGPYIAGLVLAGLFLITPGGFVSGYLNFRLHRMGENLEMAGLSAGFFTAVVYAIISFILALISAIANSANAGNTMIAWVLSVIFAFMFFLLGGYISGYLERRPYQMPSIFNLSGLSRGPPPPPVAAAQMCPTCGRPMTFMQQYNRWYCPNCKKYP